jgi:ribosomal protein S18 acetylase RimI-like enzyme
MTFIDDVRREIDRGGPDVLPVDDLHPSDLARIGWSGSPRHVQSVEEVLKRVEKDEAEYLAVRAPDGTPVALGAINYWEAPAAGTIFQLSTHVEVQGLGLGTRLIEVAEERIRRRGLRAARVGVEDDNPRARHLYERLGYASVGRRHVSWEAQRSDGSLFLYETVITDLEKPLTAQA